MSDKKLAEFTVGCLCYHVCYGSPTVLEDVNALADHEARTVWLRSSLPPAHMLAVLLHEIIHVGMLAYGHNTPGADAPTFCEERAANVAGAIVAEALTRSPALVDLIAILAAGDKI
jgi:hypothetical protein